MGSNINASRAALMIGLSVLAGHVAGEIAAADVFLLRSGGRIAGELLNPNQSPRETFEIQVVGRGLVTLARTDVKGIEYRSAEETQYETIRHKAPDTVDGHTKLAQWCLTHSLLQQRRSHLERILQLDPEDEAARTALGYRSVNGRWMTREEEMAARGMVLYEGRYRTTQEIELLQNNEAQNLAERQWHNKVKRWYDWLGTRKHDQAIEGFQSIEDPRAVPALAKYVAPEKDHEPSRDAKLLLLEIVARLGSSAAVDVLVDRSLNDTDLEVRLSAMDHLTARKDPGVAGRFVSSLRSKDNRIVNRAAVALQVLENPSVIPALIDSLITEHKFKIVKGNPGQMSASFNPSGGGGGGMSFGGGGPQIIRRDLSNPQVLTALVSLTGVNYQYDQTAWKAWLRSQNKTESIDVRRD